MLLAESRIEFVGVDKNKVFLDCARKKTSGYENFKFVLCDVLDYESSEKFDVALLTSAYHHVKNEFKAKLLRKVFGLLKREGVLVVYEKAIKPYSNEREFEESNEEFYAKRIAFLKKTERRGLSKKQLAALLNVCALSAAAEEEYKLDYARLIRDLNAAGFKIIKETKVWPSGEEGVFGNEKVGDFVLVAIKRWS
jgi:ubiquinone/menaquinone biosynthesis C-methylase UbiE